MSHIFFYINYSHTCVACVWEFMASKAAPHSPLIGSPPCLPNGNTLINFGNLQDFK